MLQGLIPPDAIDKKPRPSIKKPSWALFGGMHQTNASSLMLHGGGCRCGTQAVRVSVAILFYVPTFLVDILYNKKYEPINTRKKQIDGGCM
jgi:ABC-type uncharacterized transport system fused permease/ATPase subunit